MSSRRCHIEIDGALLFARDTYRPNGRFIWRTLDTTERKHFTAIDVLITGTEPNSYRYGKSYV